VSDTSVEDVRASGPVERLLEESWGARSERIGRRELLVESAAGLLFAAVAVPLAVLALERHGADPLLACCLLILYAISSRLVKFAIGAGYVVPSYMVLVPMLLLLPAGLVPLLAAGGLVLGSTLQWLAGKVAPARIALSVPDAWHTLGPVAVLLAAGTPHGGASTALLYLAAFAAGCIVDLLSSTLREAAIMGVAPRIQLRVISLVWLIDACIAPLGLLVAHAARTDHAQVLLILPLNGAMLLASHDRDRRIAQAQQRLEAVAHERSRLQSAVRRLGEALAARLDLGELTRIVLRSSIEALDAEGGRLVLEGPGMPPATEIGCSEDAAASVLGALDRARACSGPVQLERDGHWSLAVPLAFSGRSGRVDGAVAVTRPGRAFQADEQAVMEDLVERARRAAADIVSHQILHEQAHTDTLTGLGNRRKLAADVRLWQGRRHEPRVLMLFDLDGFKGYNDTFGHMAGDAMLSRLGGKLAGAVAGQGAAYRLGGDEFCALLDARHPELGALVAAAVAALEERGENFHVRASFGAVLLPHETDSVEFALQLADERMYERKRDRPARSPDHTSEVLRQIMTARHPGLESRSGELAELARRLGMRLGVHGEALDELVRAAELGDIGKVGIPEAILAKAGPLSAEEWEFMRQQPLLGERILGAAPALRPVAALIRSAHERWDGRGYPDGLAGERTPLGARIIGVCSAYLAMRSERSFRPARDHAEACAELRLEAGRQFDPAVVEALLAELEGDSTAPATEEPIEPDARTAHEVAAKLLEMLSEGAPGTRAPHNTHRARAWPGDR
jgi:diguanylate cyclase (GGDEF)-like protein